MVQTSKDGAMFLQMGRKPSEAQIRQIMKSVNANRK